jgi:hypothetical protein
MLFMVMHKLTPEIESGAPPDRPLIDAMGKLIGETIEQGKFHNAAGLHRTAQRVRLRCKGGQCAVTRGPLQGEHELLAGFAQIKVKSMDEAIAWTQRIAEADGGEVEFDIGPVVERWDLGLVPKPNVELPLNALIVRKADAAFERGERPASATSPKVQAVLDEMRKEGVLLATETLKPSARGARLRTAQGKHTWIDGPFAESKEMISGFTILKADSLAEAKAWTDRYADILGDIEVDVREVEG